jgi:hypothetical protein
LSGDYSLVDRALHHIAFCHPAVQRALSDIENDLFGGKFKEIKPERAVFITGLPRAGTTMLLNLFYRTDEFVAHTYRHMPFILSPLLWAKISRPFKRRAELKERAHADGVMISFDAPEAFEEVIWLSYLRNTIVQTDRLSPLAVGDVSAEFYEKLQDSMQKLIYLAGNAGSSAVAPRYLSKNNANISRIEVLAQLFPDATIVVPFRHPLAHAGSLMRQHERFTVEHGRDRFAKNYMEWLGHYEFGDNFRPINFDGWLDGVEIQKQIDLDFWLRYWTVAYRYVLDNGGEQVVLVNFDQLLSDSGAVLGRISDRVGLNSRSTFIQGEEILCAPATKALDPADVSSESWSAAQELHTQLEQQAI